MSPLLLLLAAHDTVPVTLQHRSGQGANHRRRWEFGRTEKCFRSGAAYRDRRWGYVGAVYKWTPSSLRCMPWAGERSTGGGRRQQCLVQLNLFLSKSTLKCRSLGAGGGGVGRGGKEKKTWGDKLLLLIWDLRYEALDTAKESQVWPWWGLYSWAGRIDWTRCWASSARDFSGEIRHVSVKNWLVFCYSILDPEISLHYRSQETKLGCWQTSWWWFPQQQKTA